MEITTIKVRPVLNGLVYVYFSRPPMAASSSVPVDGAIYQRWVY